MKNNKKSIIGSIVTVILFIIITVLNADKGGMYTSQANNDQSIEQLESLENLTIRTGSDCITKIPDDNNLRMYCLDVGQGDSAVIITKGKKDVILIDTGGIRNTLVSNNVILYLKSQGIKRIDTLILTHGDFDHMGDAENIITKMKVKKVILNKSLDNELEISLIQKLKKENIPYTHEPQNISLANGQIIFLNKKIFSEENDDSNVLLLELDNKKILFMGDASKDTEEYLINTYNLPKIDILKVGHHGSKTSSSNGFITQIKPYYAVISVGRNNIYHHPNAEVLDILKNSTVYRTDEKGSIIFKLKNNKLKITTYYGKEKEELN